MKNKIFSNYIYNTLYQILVLITPLITTPYISRVLGVSNIGIYQYTQSIANFFVLIGAVGTTLYGQREIAYLQDDPEKRTIAFWEIEIFRLTVTIMSAVLYLYIYSINGTYREISTILTIEVIATGLDISWLYMGMENFKLTVIRNTIIKVTGIVCVFLFVKKPEDLGLYTICVTAPLFIGNISLWFSINKYIVKVKIGFREIVSGIRKRLKPILILFLPQIAADVYLLLDKTMIGVLGSNIDQVGYYSQGQKIVQIVLRVITSLGTVMLPTMSALFARGDKIGIQNNIRKTFRFIYMLSFAMQFGLIAVAPRFVPIFFGDGYEPVVFLMTIISPIMVFIATSNVIGKQYLLPTNQQKIFTMSIVAGACVNFTLNLYLIESLDAIGASIATVLAEFTVMGVQCWYVRKVLPLKEFFRSAGKYAVYSLIMFLVVRGVDCILPAGRVWSLIVLIIIGLVVYSVELIISKDETVKMALNIFKRKLDRKNGT